MIRMRVTAPTLSYNTRRMVAGDTFSAKEGDARVLENVLRKAVRDIDRPVTLSGRTTNELETARLMAVALNITVDGRWGVKRLKQEIESRKAS